LDFYPRDAMLARVFARERVCLSVCPSVCDTPVLCQKQRKLASWFLHCLVAPRF